jgi:hypothetical protein
MKKYFLSIIALFVASIVYGQVHKWSYNITYPIAFPTGDLNDYAGSTSFRGVSFEANAHLNEKYSVGIEAGWNTFYERVDSKTYTSGTASISGVQYRYSNQMPILFGGKMYFGGSATTKFNGGLGLGTMYVNRSTDFGLYRITNETWQFCLRPEIGMAYKIRPGLAGVVGLKYYAAFNTSDLDGQSYWTINIGVMLN